MKLVLMVHFILDDMDICFFCRLTDALELMDPTDIVYLADVIVPIIHKLMSSSYPLRNLLSVVLGNSQT